jgi:hypothetical protein
MLGRSKSQAKVGKLRHESANQHQSQLQFPVRIRAEEGLTARARPVRIVGRHERGKATELRARDERPDMNRGAANGAKINLPDASQPNGQSIAVARSVTIPIVVADVFGRVRY